MKHSYLLLFFFISYYCEGQYNLVPNFDFTHGINQPGCLYSYCPNDPQKIENDILFWSNALHNPNCFESCINGFWSQFGTCPTSDWIDVNSCTGISPPISNSDRFIRVLTSDKKNFYEGVKVPLLMNLQSNVYYILKIKLATNQSSVGKGLELDVHATTWNEHWNSKRKGNTRVRDIANFNMSGLSHDWHTFFKIFKVPQSKHGLINNLILIRRNTDNTKNTTMYIDQVELYEYCPSILPFQDRTFNMTEILPYEAQNIVAGESIVGFWPNGQVKVFNTSSSAKFKASKTISLMPGFNVERGGKFRGWISPCLFPCPFPTADAGRDTTICGTGCIQIGSEDEYGMTYKWTSETEESIQFLSSTSSPNPIVCPPSFGRGRLRYKIMTTNQCGQSREDEVIVDYDNDPNPIPNFTVTNLDLSDSLSFDLIVDPHTEVIKVEILDCNTPSNVLRTYFYEGGDDFNCCNFNFKIDRYYNSCLCYKVRVSTKNYCFPNWKDTVFTWQRNTPFSFLNSSSYICKNKLYDASGWLWFHAKGTSWYNIEVKNRWGQTMFQNSGIYNHDSMYVWHPDGNISSGTYYIILDLYDCNGIKHTYTFSIEIFDTCSNKTSSVYSDLSNSRIFNSSLSKFVLSPNPSRSYFEIRSIIDSKENLNLSVVNALGQTVYVENAISIGPYSEVVHMVNTSSWSEGTYFVIISSDNFHERKKIIIIK